MESSQSSFSPNNPVDLARMRNAAAGMIKNLVAARAKSDPDWVKKAEIDRHWFPTTRRPTTQSATYLIVQSANGFREFGETFSGPLDSVPCVNENDESPAALAEKLMDLLCQFTNHEELIQAADILRRGGKSFSWDLCANWELLPELRSLLNRFPNCSKEERSPQVGNQNLSTSDPDIVMFGERKQKCPGNTWKLLNHLVRQPKYKCELQEFAEPLLGDHAQKVTIAYFDPVASRANTWLEKNNVPFKVSRTKDVIQLEATAHESDTKP